MKEGEGEGEGEGDGEIKRESKILSVGIDFKDLGGDPTYIHIPSP